MTIALDYDDTFTADPEFWRGFIRSAKDAGHEVVCVTCRRDTIENRQMIDAALEPEAVKLFCTGLAAKRWFMQERGWRVDIWIDDNVEGILYGR